MLRALLLLLLMPATAFCQEATQTRDNAPPVGARARQFVETTQNRPPRENLLLALELFGEQFEVAGQQETLRAADLGAGAGNESLHLMRSGWDVLAIDSEPHAAEVIEKYAAGVAAAHPEDVGRIVVKTSKMQDVNLPHNSLHLINASFSFPFVPSDEMDAVWEQCVSGLKSGGVITCHFFGPAHEWRDREDMSFFSVDQIFDRFVREQPVELRYLLHEGRDVKLAVGDTAYFDTVTVIVQKVDD